MSELVMIEAVADSVTGLRRAVWALLESGALRGEIDSYQRGRLFLAGSSGKAKPAGPMVHLFVERERAREVMLALRDAYEGEQLQQYALPVLDTL